MNLLGLNATHVGRTVSFGYEGKPRTGKLDKVADNYFTIELPEGVVNENGRRYSSFNYNKLQGAFTIH